MPNFARTLSLLLVLCPLFAACSELPPTVPVEGKVTLNGEPIPGCEVTFHPAQGRPGMGRTDDQGHFVLSTFEGPDGAVPGQHKVTVVKFEEIPGPADNPYKQYRNLMSEDLATKRTTPLSAAVERGKENNFTFELEQK